MEFLIMDVLKLLERVHRVTLNACKIYDVALRGLTDILVPTKCHSPRPSFCNYLYAFSEFIFPLICFWAYAFVPA